ncbi:MAG: type II toxin-antitoxin system VapC family toxin [Steroidobacteraceae bacterium]
MLDTHFWIWWLTPASPLRSAERNALDAAAEAGSVYLAAISLWEAQLLHSKRRLQLPLPFSDWLIRATESRVLTVLPLDRDVVIAVDSLPTRFHGDPADRLIVATARTHGMPLATRDRVIRRSRAAKLWSP